MARFVPNEPVTTTKPRITVDAGLAPGVYRFRLVLVDSRGRKSAPAEIAVSIVRR